MKLLNKRAQVGNLSGFFMGIGVASIVLVVVMIIIQELTTTAEQSYDTTWTTDNTTVTSAGNASNAVLTKLATAPTWIGLIILAGLAFIVLGFFMGRGRGQ